MGTRIARRLHATVAGGLALVVLGCGGGRTAVVGLGNSDNRIVEGGMLEEVAEALAEHPGTPQVTDEMLARIFSAILGRATQGDPEAALIVLQVAEEQRDGSEG